MGAANSCTCSENKKYRFKNFVVSSYPENDEADTPDVEGLDKLSSYVDNNPERIPRVCRKINKILAKDLKEKNEKHVVVSSGLLESLMEGAKTVDGFVPYTIEICVVLLKQPSASFKICAANVLSIMCDQLRRNREYLSSYRLLAASSESILPSLVTMGKSKNRETSFAGVVALGHFLSCLDQLNVIAGQANEVMTVLLADLAAALKTRSKRPVEASAGCTSLLLSPSVKPPVRVAVPATPDEEEVARIQSIQYGICAIASCTSATEVRSLLDCVFSTFDNEKLWTVPYMPMLTFHALVRSLEDRPQRLGCSVYFRLCDLVSTPESQVDGKEVRTPSSLAGVLRALIACLDALPMSGARATRALQYLRRLLEFPRVLNSADEKSSYERDVVSLAVALLRSILRQGSECELRNVVTALLAASTHTSSDTRRLSLLCLGAASPFVRAIPLPDRRALNVCGAVRTYLYGSNEDECVLAARVVRGLLAGMPMDGAEVRHDPLIIVTDERDITFAQEWLITTVNTAQRSSARVVAEVGHMLASIISGYGASALPFVLQLLWTLQQHCVQADSPSASKDSGLISPMLSSKSDTSPLTRAWLHMIAAVIVSAGRAYNIPKLSEYGNDILSRRRAAEPSQLAACFEADLRFEESGSLTLTSCGLVVATQEKKGKSLLSATLNLPPVAKLPLFSFISSVIADAERDDIMAVFGRESSEEVKTAIEMQCFTTEVQSAPSPPLVEKNLDEPFWSEEFSLKWDRASTDEVHQFVLVDSAASEDCPPMELKSTSSADRVQELLQLFQAHITSWTSNDGLSDEPLPLFATGNEYTVQPYEEEIADRTATSGQFESFRSSVELTVRQNDDGMGDSPVRQSADATGILPFKKSWLARLPAAVFMDTRM